MKKFSDFAKEDAIMDGDKLKLDEILNKEITVKGFKVTDSKYSKSNSNKCMKLHFKLNDKNYITFTGSNVLIDQMEKYKNETPFITTIIKIDKYYTFS